jgi:hypothetical protein
LLKDLASLRPEGGSPGQAVEQDLDPSIISSLIQRFDTFRHNLAKAVSVQDVWPLLLLVMGWVFFADVFVRRVTIGLDTLAPLWAAVRRRVWPAREAQAEVEQNIERLRSRKAAVSEQIDERRASARFEPETPTATDAEQILQQASGGTEGPRESTPRAQPRMAPGETADEESYTSRLLKAKQRARQDRDGASE